MTNARSAERVRYALVVGALCLFATGCGGGVPLLHGAHALPEGVVRAQVGTSAQIATGGLASDVREARRIAAEDPSKLPPAKSDDYAKGALVLASVAPGLAPLVGARAGVGNGVEGGIGYTGRALRIDGRKVFDWSNGVALSLGIGASGAFYGDDPQTALPALDLSKLRAFGGDVPILVGWKSQAGLYQAWAGARAGYERATIESLTSEPKAVSLGTPPIGLEADRFWGGGLVGLAAGFRRVHVAVEIAAAYQSVKGTYNGSSVSVQGLALTPATALWVTF